VQPAKLEDVAAIEVIGFRAADEHECRVAIGDSAAEQCYKALEMSEAITLSIMNEGYPVGMFGIAPFSAMGIPPGTGVLWLLGSEGIKEIRDDFLLQSRDWINFLQIHYPFGFNFVHAENHASLRWCEFVGFKFEGEMMYGIDPENQELFVKAVRVPD
jgi:hypothetical protein